MTLFHIFFSFQGGMNEGIFEISSTSDLYKGGIKKSSSEYVDFPAKWILKLVKAFPPHPGLLTERENLISLKVKFGDKIMYDD